jgi:hypothetical protein
MNKLTITIEKIGDDYYSYVAEGGEGFGRVARVPERRRDREDDPDRLALLDRHESIAAERENPADVARPLRRR